MAIKINDRTLNGLKDIDDYIKSLQDEVKELTNTIDTLKTNVSSVEKDVSTLKEQTTISSVSTTTKTQGYNLLNTLGTTDANSLIFAVIKSGISIFNETSTVATVTDDYGLLIIVPTNTTGTGAHITTISGWNKTLSSYEFDALSFTNTGDYVGKAYCLYLSNMVSAVSTTKN